MKNLIRRALTVAAAAATGVIILIGLIIIVVAILTEEDARDSQFEFTYSPGSEEGPIVQIRHLGRDGKEGPTMPPYSVGPFVATAFDDDIVWADGFFVRYPAGAQVD